MTYGSVCSGIEAASVAWHSLGWKPKFFAEIDKFPSAVLAHHYPEVPNLGDFTRIDESAGPIDLLVGGTPCQDFSIAGMRDGLDGARGNLTLEYIKLAGRIRPRWLLWENVPGVLSVNEGRAMGAFLGGLAELGYGFAYRVLDAKYFGIPQRRRRVFVVGYLGDWRRAAAVLFERESFAGHPSQGSEAWEDVAPTPGASSASGGRTPGTCPDSAAGLIAKCLNAKGGNGRLDYESETFIAHTTGAGHWNDGAGTLRARGQESHEHLVGFCNTAGRTGLGVTTNAMPPMTRRNGDPGMVAASRFVRRITPLEAERLQGFPDGYTAIPYRGKPAADGPRYKALGNSMAVPVMRWIGERISRIESIYGMNS